MVRIPPLSLRAGDLAAYDTVITRAEFEESCMDLLQRLASPVESTLEEAGLDKSDINEVILMGGSSRMPYIKNWLANYFEIPVESLRNSVSEDEGVAIGATTMAAILTGQKEQTLTLNDICPISVGVLIPGNRMEPVIERRNTLPCSAD